MNSKTQVKIDYILGHHKSETITEMAKVLETSASGVLYLVNKLGINELTKKGKHPTKRSQTGPYFDVDAVGHERTWLI